MALKLVAPPGVEPITLAQAKEHIRVDTNLDDSLIESLIKTAREYCECFQGRSYITQVWRLVSDGFPSKVFEIPNPPL